MVFSSRPVIWASNRSPPAPTRWDSTATYQRRCCSSSRREPQIHLPMQLLIRMRHFLLAMRTLTMMHLCSWHNLFPSSLVLSLAYSTSSLLLSPACSLEWKLFFNDYLEEREDETFAVPCPGECGSDELFPYHHFILSNHHKQLGDSVVIRFCVRCGLSHHLGWTFPRDVQRDEESGKDGLPGSLQRLCFAGPETMRRGSQNCKEAREGSQRKTSAKRARENENKSFLVRSAW